MAEQGNARPLRRITVDITNKCNLKCIMCPQHRLGGERYDMPAEVYRRIVPALKLTQELFFSCAFEALMSSSFAEILELTRPANVPEWVLITNATLLDEEAAERIIDAGIRTVVISMDGASKESYERVRQGATFEKTCANIALFGEVKRRKGALKPDLNLTFTLMRSNIGEIPSLVKLARSLDVPKVNIKPVQVLFPIMRKEGLQPSDAENVMRNLEEARRVAAELGVTVTTAPEIESLSGPKADAGTPSERPRRCVEPFPSLYVRPNGKVYPCTIWRLAQFGDLHHQDFEEIWNGEDFVRLRDEIATGNLRPCCECCTYAL